MGEREEGVREKRKDRQRGREAEGQRRERKKDRKEPEQEVIRTERIRCTEEEARVRETGQELK